MRLAGSTLVGLVLAAVLATAAVAAVKVTASTSKLELTTPTLFIPNTPTRIYNDYDIVVEPYKDAIRTGYRIRPREGQSTGKIDTSDGDCFRNPVVNDVVCSKFSRSIEIDLTNSGDDDRVVIREIQREGDLDLGSPGRIGRDVKVCYTRVSLASAVTSAVVRLGAGADTFSVRAAESVCPTGTTVGRPHGIDLAELELNGGSGSDTLTGGWGSKATVFGGSGNDTIVTRIRADEVDGGTGNDTIELGDGNDRGNGGSGNDSVNGQEGNDILRGDEGDDRLTGSSGNDVAEGGAGNDTIAGDAGIDQLRGGPGADSITGGDGDDVIWTDDDNTSSAPTRDEVNCGPGRDTAYVDPVDNPVACEVVIRHASADGLPAYVTGQSVTIPANGNTQFEVRCPGQAGVRCTGTLTVSAAGAFSILAKQSYDLAVGQVMTYIVPIPGPRPGTVVARTSEPGQTQTRSATVTLPVVF